MRAPLPVKNNFFLRFISFSKLYSIICQTWIVQMLLLGQDTRLFFLEKVFLEILFRLLFVFKFYPEAGDGAWFVFMVFSYENL